MPVLSRFRIAALAGALCLAVAPVRAAVTAIELAHPLDETRAAHLARIVERFNAQHKEFQVRLVPRGAAPSAAHLSLATTGEVAHFASERARFKPLYEVMKEAREKFDANSLDAGLRAAVSDGRGRLVALPVALATPVLFYNKAAFARAGLDPDKPPRTWWEVQTAAGKLFDAGVSCPYTTSWPAWVHIDNVAARNGGEVADAKGNPAFNGLIQVKHIALLASWHKSRYFTYFGRGDEADHHFAAGECGMLTSSSSFAPRLRENPALEVGVAPLPFYDDAWGAPRTATADGASLWVAAGKKPAEYKAVARFVRFLVGADAPTEMTEAGGFLPMTPMARTAVKKRLPGVDLAGLDVAYGQLQGRHELRALRISQIEPVRLIVDEELEAVWDNRKPAKEALDHAVSRAAAILPALARNTPL